MNKVVTNAENLMIDAYFFMKNAESMVGFDDGLKNKLSVVSEMIVICTEEYKRLLKEREMENELFS